MRIFYSHCTLHYDTLQEARDEALLTSLGFTVYTPNNSNCAAGYQTAGMEHFRALVEACDALAFRALPDGSISAGVAFELEVALQAGKPILELPTGLRRRARNVADTREFLRDSGSR
jgi:hypothetical protein